MPGTQLCQADGTFAACACAPPDAGPTTGEVAGVVSLFGVTDASGIAVTLSNGALTRSTTTDAEGGYAFEDVPPGLYRLAFSKSVALPPDAGWLGADGGAFMLTFADAIPAVLALPGQNAQVLEDDVPSALALFTIFPGRRVLELGTQTATIEAVTPDLAWIAYRVGTTLFLASTDGGAPMQLGTGVPAYATFFSPDGHHLAFVSGSSSTQGSLYLAQVSTTPAPRTVGSVSEQSGAEAFKFTADSRYLVFRYGEPHLLYAIDASSESGYGQQLSNEVGSYEISPDQAHIAFVTHLDGGAGDLQVAQLDGAQPPITIGHPVPNSSTAYAFSPDGDQLAFITRSDLTETLWVTPIDGSTSPVQLGHAFGVGFAPDGRHVVFDALDEAGLDIVEISGAEPAVQIAPRAPSTWQWSPDGDHFLFISSGDPGLPSLNLWSLSRGGAPVELGPMSPFALAAVRFSADGSRLAFLQTSDLEQLSCTLVVASTQDPTVRAEVGTGVPALFSSENTKLAPDGRHVLFVGGSTDNAHGWLELADTSGAAPPNLLGSDFLFVIPATASFSPDSRSVAFAASDGGEPRLQLGRVDPPLSPLPLLDRATILVHAQDRLAALRTSHAAPYDFQHGVYVFDLAQPAPSVP